MRLGNLRPETLLLLCRHSPWHLEVWLWKEVPSVVRKESVFIVWIVSLTVENRESKGNVQEESGTGWRDPSWDRFMVPSSAEDVIYERHAVRSVKSTENA